MRKVFLIGVLMLAAVSLSAATSSGELLRTLAEMDVLDGSLGSGRISVVSIGNSAGGRQIPLVVIRNPEVPVDSTRRIFIICRQHGDEPAPTEAMLSLIRTYFAHPSAEDMKLLDRVTFVIVPMMNPDGAAGDQRRNGAGADLNRDWILRRQPETRAVASAVDRWAPSFVLDEHELDRHDHRRDWVEAVGPGSGADIGVIYEIGSLEQMVVAKLRTAGLSVRVVRDKDHRPARLAHRFFPLRRGIPALLLESRQSGRRAWSIDERIRLHVTATMTAARCLAGDSEAVRQEVAAWHVVRIRK